MSTFAHLCKLWRWVDAGEVLALGHSKEAELLPAPAVIGEAVILKDQLPAAAFRPCTFRHASALLLSAVTWLHVSCLAIVTLHCPSCHWGFTLPCLRPCPLPLLPHALPSPALQCSATRLLELHLCYTKSLGSLSNFICAKLLGSTLPCVPS